MDSIKKLLSPSRNGGKKKNAESRKQEISWPLERSPHKQERTNTWAGLYEHIDNVKMNFTPRTRGEQATLAFMNSGGSDDLKQLLNERDRAERQVYRGPKTKGNKEVQLILREPSIKSVEQFYRVCEQAEISAKYGVPGEVVYNFSRSLNWNKTNTPKSSSLQLTDFGIVKGERRGLFSNPQHIPRTLSPPIDWLDLGTYKASTGNSRPLSPISEPGGWRNLPHPETYEESGLNLRSCSLMPPDVDICEGEWKVEQAVVLGMKKVPIWKVGLTSSPFR
ncbi:hypothetical protein F5Y06DRAFT_292940 [Hypoxylon sp. FL0890]|nr:hypothetical protein F5Y06DRAFT_292940 [Hypoxylon sp. FL0890]